MDDGSPVATHGADHILIVDDARGVRDVLAIKLGREGYSVSVADSARAALEMIDARLFDLILLDIGLSDMNGLELLARLRRSRTPLDVPIIVISGHDQPDDVVTALNNGANDYVVKPFDLAVVLARLRTQLSIKHLKQTNDRFLRIASHDLKKPLLIVLDVARQLKSERPAGTPLTDDDLAGLSMLIDSAEFMQQIIEDLLGLSALRAGKLRVTRHPTDLGAVVRQAVARNSVYAGRKGIGLRMQFGPDIPNIMADDFRLMQVLDNLIGNAIKFSPANTAITVHTRRDGASLLCEIVDTGPGIPEAEMGKLFIEYAQLSNQPTGGEKSTGLGLSISREIVLLHGGEIGARNNADAGATFWFRLPLD
jgi:signal transduction histidine kinase